MRYIKLLHTIIALALGVTLSLLLLQHNPYIQKQAINHLISFLEKEWKVTISLESSYINLFTQKIHLVKGQVKPTNHDCTWQFAYGSIATNLFELLLKKKLSLYVTFNEVAATTSFFDNQWAIKNHLLQIFETKQTAIKVRPKIITLNHIATTINYKNHTANVLLDGSFNLLRHKKRNTTPAQWEGLITGKNSTITVNNHLLMKNITSNISFNKPLCSEQWEKNIKLDGTLVTPHTSYHATIVNKEDDYSIINDTHTINLTSTLNHEAATVQGILPASLLEYWYHLLEHHLLSYKPLMKDETGQLSVKLGLKTPMPTMTGNFTLKNHPLLPQVGATHFSFNNNILLASLQATTFNHVPVVGKMYWHLPKKEGTFQCTNEKRIGIQSTEQSSTNKWYIEAQEATIKATIDRNKKVKGNFLIPLHNAISKEVIPFKGSFTAHHDSLHIHGTLFEDTFLAIIKLFPHPHIIRFEYISEENDQQLASLKQDKNNPFILKGTIAFAAIQALFNPDMKHTILGEKSTFAVTIDQTNLAAIGCSLSLDKGSLYIPESHNLLEKCTLSARIALNDKKIHLTNSSLQFHKGTIICPQAIIAWDDNFSLTNVHIPLEINDLFINWKRDLYAFIYGNMLISKKTPDPLSLTGSLFLKKSLLKDNIFSQSTNDKIYLPMQTMPFSQEQMRIKLAIATQTPIKIKTPSLSTQATINLQVKHSYHKTEFNIPHVSGSIILNRGSLKLLHNTLFIEYGRLEFPAYQSNDPIIELTAKNRIHKYLVTLHATGSLQKPNIILESIPELPEEQILGLLLGGSETTSLQQDLPTILLQNLNAILIGTTHLPPKTNTFIELLTKPLKYVQIIPNFTDQSGRGGIKGTISVDINKQLHAQFQKNFNLQEDFSFQVEYILSDDINVKAVKDQRGELGAELELRLKL